MKITTECDNELVLEAMASASDDAEKLKVKFGDTLAQMEKLNPELEREKFTELWSGMATDLKTQIPKLDSIAGNLEGMETDSEKSLLLYQKLQIKAKKMEQKVQTKVNELVAELSGLQNKIRQNKVDVAREKEQVALHEAEVEKAIKERTDAALSMIPFYGLVNAIFGGGKIENINPMVALAETAFSLVEQDVERALDRVRDYESKARSLEQKLKKTEGSLKGNKDQLEDAKKHQDQYKQDYDLWSKRKIAMGQLVTKVRNIKSIMNEAITNCHLTLENKVADSQIWIDAHGAGMFARKKNDLLRRLDGTSAKLREIVDVSMVQGKKIRGWNVANVSITVGESFVDSGGKRWKQVDKDGKERFKFVEVGRDEWSVYIVDNSRDMALKVDLWQKKVFWCNANGKATDYNNHESVIAFIHRAF